MNRWIDGCIFGMMDKWIGEIIIMISILGIGLLKKYWI